MMENMMITAVVFVFGTLIGSFLNVCIVRIPRRLSLVFPSSHCPVCRTPIPFYCNIPLLSYLALGGRCRFCRAPIPLQYFVVELLTPLVMIWLYAFWGLSPAFGLAAVFAAALIVITFIDLQHQIIPDAITLPGIPICFACSFVAPWVTPADSLIGIAAGGGVLYLFALGYHLLTKKEGMGGGDIKLLAMIGAFLGWKGALATLVLAACAGSVIGIVLMVLQGRDRTYAIPFGPFLSAGALCSLLYGEELIRIYLTIGVPG
jgi:leader peptidase (prepilin peptidase) / N-methyltransferase